MKKLFILLLMITSCNIVYAENLTTQDKIQFASDIDKSLNYADGENVRVRYAKTPRELADGMTENLIQFENRNEGKAVGGAMCIVHVLDNGNLALTFLSDEEVQKFHEETDKVLDKYYGGYDETGFQHLSGDTQTHVTTMILKRIEKKRRFGFKK